MGNAKNPERPEGGDSEEPSTAESSADRIGGEGNEGAVERFRDREHAGWTAVLGKLGGSSPGSEENLRLGEIFRRVKFPADRGQVLEKLDPGAEFLVRPGVALDMREAVELSRVSEFRNLNDLIDCVKDALRRADALERHPT